MIEVQNLKKYYGENEAIKAVDDVSFCCPDGQITGLLGPNGAGKTTTLRMITGLIKPRSGTVIVNGCDVTHSLALLVASSPPSLSPSSLCGCLTGKDCCTACDR
jgi:ABC-type Na+ transport system ATPase subunit NatA